MHDKRILSYATPVKAGSLGPFPGELVIRSYFYSSAILREADKIQLTNPAFQGIEVTEFPEEGTTKISTRTLANLMSLELDRKMSVPIPRSSRNKIGAFSFKTSHSAVSRLYLSLGPAAAESMEGGRFRAAFTGDYQALVEFLMKRYGTQACDLKNFVSMEADLAVMASALAFFLYNLSGVGKLHAFLDECHLLWNDLRNPKIVSYALIGEAPRGLCFAAVTLFAGTPSGPKLALDLKKNNWEPLFDHLWRFLSSARQTHPYFMAFLERLNNTESKGNAIKVSVPKPVKPKPELIPAPSAESPRGQGTAPAEMPPQGESPSVLVTAEAQVPAPALPLPVKPPVVQPVSPWGDLGDALG